MFPATLAEHGRTWRPGRPVALHATLGTLRRGRADPTYQVGADGAVWLTSRPATGPVTLRLVVHPACGEVAASAWGPGAREVLAGVPRLLGADDDVAGFEPRHPVVRAAWRRQRGWRVPRTERVLEALVPAVLEQRVTGREAWRAWRTLLDTYGSVAPGPAPAGMRVVPDAATWAALPSWDWHLAGVDPRRAATTVRAARVAGRLEETTGMPTAAALARLTAVPGVGAWTAAEVRQRAHGDPDTVSVGDLHLPRLVGWVLAGRPVDDAGMLELLAPYAGHRYRVVRLLELSGVGYPRFAPRFAPQDISPR